MINSGYAFVNELEIYYEVYSQGKPIVLLHGSYLTIPLGAHYPLLVKDRQAIAVEMQAYGRTRDISREASYEAMADDVAGLLKHLVIESTDILGYSMRGGIAF